MKGYVSGIAMFCAILLQSATPSAWAQGQGSGSTGTEARRGHLATGEQAIGGPIGACCLPAPDCVDTPDCVRRSSGECAALGGVYQGDNTLCTDLSVDCRAGACCIGDNSGNCNNALSECECFARGGIWQGAGTSCTSIPSCFGACYFLTGDCASGSYFNDCEVTTQYDCELTLGGIFAGNNTSCVVDGAIGACCLMTGVCDATSTEQECEAAGGIFQGARSTCLDTCAGACCLDPLGECSITSEAACIDAGGHYQGNGTLCPVEEGCFSERYCRLYFHTQEQSEDSDVESERPFPKFDTQGGFRQLTKVRVEVVSARIFAILATDNTIIKSVFDYVVEEPTDFLAWKTANPAVLPAAGRTLIDIVPATGIQHGCNDSLEFEIPGLACAYSDDNGGSPDSPIFHDAPFPATVPATNMFFESTVEGILNQFELPGPPFCVSFESHGNFDPSETTNVQYREFHVVEGEVCVTYEYEVLGACCYCDVTEEGLPTTICEEQFTQEECEDVAGSWFPFETCDDIDDPGETCYLGYCCLPSGECIGEISRICCEDPDVGGTWFDSPCGEEGACCFPDDGTPCGSCIETSELCCEEIYGGVFYEAEECGPTGRCCYPVAPNEYTCCEAYELCCESKDGQFEAGVPCDQLPFPPGWNCVEEEECGQCDEKGSLVIFSKIEVRWDSKGNLVQDTFVKLTNDAQQGVHVLMYFVNGDEPLEATDVERAHLGWNYVDNGIFLTQNQPVWWAASSGLPFGVSPWTILDPGDPPGRPSDDGSGDRVLRGFIYAWATNATHEEIRWNHLFGEATLVYYNGGAAWEYETCNFRVVDSAAPHGGKLPEPGVLRLDGTEYCTAPGELLLNYVREHAVLPDSVCDYTNGGGGEIGGPPLQINTDVTVHPVSADFRLNEVPPTGPVSTSVEYKIWDADRQPFATHLCVTCWDQRFLRQYYDPEVFEFDPTLCPQAYARLDGKANVLCDEEFGVTTQSAAILGVYARWFNFPPDGKTPQQAAGEGMIGHGSENAIIMYDLGTQPPQQQVGGPPEAFRRGDWYVEDIRRERRMRAGVVDDQP